MFRRNPARHLERHLSNDSVSRLAQQDELALNAIKSLLKKQALGPGLYGILKEQAMTGDKACKRFISATNEIPSWVSFQKMQAGKKVVLSHVIQSNLALLLGCMVEAFSDNHFALLHHQLDITDQGMLRKVYQTAQFTYTIYSAESLTPGSPAHRSILNTRLMNAASSLLNQGGPGITHLDYLKMNIIFSYVFRRCLKALGTKLSKDEEASLHHLWCYIYQLMGLPVAQLTPDIAREEEVYSDFVRSEAPGKAGKDCVQQLIRLLAYRSPFFLPGPALSAISRNLVGNTLADQLELNHSPLWMSLASSVSSTSIILDRIQASMPWGELVAQRAGDFIIREMINDDTVSGWQNSGHSA